MSTKAALNYNVVNYNGDSLNSSVSPSQYMPNSSYSLLLSHSSIVFVQTHTVFTAIRFVFHQIHCFDAWRICFHCLFNKVNLYNMLGVDAKLPKKEILPIVFVNFYFKNVFAHERIRAQGAHKWISIRVAATDRFTFLFICQK